ncbi:dihydroorotase [Pontiella sulfatireligans]|uniref:Dihydroorotase n=1 Tax=Pontiella sulfatireligans TaxID=2750658 RepID=A0A6C2UT24_9BACT|nr:dihydroorotase [Pontiella sulfatireligans]VGO23113.1 Dihydroorotase [Pontiella sulfatireligans]
MQTILITNANLVNEGSSRPADVFIKNGRIEKVASSLTNQAADTVIDAMGKALLPGMIDCHVHCRDPGLEAKADLHSETRAAVAGGVTSIMEMPNTKPAAITNAVLEDKFALAATKCVANYSFHLGASNSNMDELLAMDPKTVCGVKLFMGASTGGLLVDRAQQLEDIFSQVKVPISLHCEDTNTIRKNEKDAREKYGEAIPFSEHWKIRSEEACYRSTALAVELATKYNSQIHVLHLTTAKELGLFKAGPVEGKKITGEACPHMLWFSSDDYDRKGALIKCNPSIKTPADRSALREAVKSGLIDTIGTDHAPHLWEEKQNPYGSAPSGLPLIQSAMPTAVELFPLEMVAEKTAHNPARIFQCLERGFIREGYWADLTLIDTETPHTVSKDNILYKCGWSPFEGVTFKSSIAATLVNGQLAYIDGQVNDAVRGQRLLFDR